MRKGKLRLLRASRTKQLVLSSPVAGTLLTFRAEVMPGRETLERTYEVTRVLANGRIELMNLQGQHAITEFEPLPT
ncbi:MAG: hypothetical protein ACMG6H_13345 [Acidobacteriota bacterium]